jgi:hypothetical protein
MNDLAHLSDDVLLTSVKRLTGTSNELTAQLLAHLAQVETRGIHRNMRKQSHTVRAMETR